MKKSIAYIEWHEAHIVYAPILPKQDPPLQQSTGMIEHQTPLFLKLITTYSGEEPADGYIIPMNCITKCILIHNNTKPENITINKSGFDYKHHAGEYVQVIWNDAAFFSKYRQINYLPQVSTTSIVVKSDDHYVYIKDPVTKLISENNYPRKQIADDSMAQYLIIPHGMIVEIMLLK